jgi:hypothetical protein
MRDGLFCENYNGENPQPMIIVFFRSYLPLLFIDRHVIGMVTKNCIKIGKEDRWSSLVQQN